MELDRTTIGFDKGGDYELPHDHASSATTKDNSDNESEENEITRKAITSAKRKRPEGANFFLEKLYDILSDDSYAQYICWSPDGDSIHVKQIHKFSHTVLPSFFKHKNFTSFIRQLNMYDFKKIKHDADWQEFRQPSFRRGQRNLIPLIRRKMPTQATLPKPSPKEDAEEVHALATLQLLQKQVGDQLAQVKAAEATMEGLQLRLSQLRNQNLTLWSEVLRDNSLDPNFIRAYFGPRYLAEFGRPVFHSFLPASNGTADEYPSVSADALPNNERTTSLSSALPLMPDSLHDQHSASPSDLFHQPQEQTQEDPETFNANTSIQDFDWTSHQRSLGP